MVRYSGPWVKKKLNFLGKYLQTYISKVYTNGFSECCYIDAFAGTGKNYIEESGETLDGSTVIAMKTIPSFTRYIFVELEDVNIVSLRRIVSEFTRDHDINVKTIYGDCNWCLPNEVLPRIPSTTPIFFFLDPFGVEELNWKTIKGIGSRGNSTTLITFSIMGVTRLSGEAGGKKILDGFYGTRNWREIARKRVLEELTAHQARKQFLELYVDQLRSEFDHAKPLFPVKDRGKYLYYLILASQNKEMIKISKNIGRE